MENIKFYTKKLTLILHLALFFSFSASAQVNFSKFFPLDTWTSIETKYFIIYFSEKSKNFAMKLSTICDKVYEDLSKKMEVKFYYKFPVVIANKSDLPNGYYIPIPKPSIVIFTSPIGIVKDFGFTDDDVKIIFLHELTHALASEEANGLFWTILRTIFGYYIVPNLYLPRNLVESITTLNESTWGYGRLNNPIFTDIVYSHAYYGKFRNFHKANLANEFPLDVGYLYGGMFFEYLLNKYGYEKILKFYKENSYYLPNFFYYSFNSVFKNDLLSEWTEFEKYISNKIFSRTSSNEFSRITSEGGEKRSLRIYKDILIYSQSQIKGELSSLKFLSINTKKSGFLIYGKYIQSFDIKDDTIAFVEVVSSKYSTKSILKVGKIKYNNSEITLVNQEEIKEINGVYEVDVLNSNEVLILTQNDLNYRILKLNLSNKLIETILESDTFYKNIDSDGKYIVMVKRQEGQDILQLLIKDSFEIIKEIKDFHFIPDLSLKGNKILFSAMDNNKIDVFEYDISENKLRKVVSGLFSFLNPISYNGSIYGISFSEKGFDIFSTEPVYQEFSKAKNNFININNEIRNLKSYKTNITKLKEYSYLNDITLYSILMTFFPDIAFNPDFSIRKIGVFFSFFDEPLEFRNFFIDLTWNFNSKTIDYNFFFIESGIPYFLIKFEILRDHIDTNSHITTRLNLKGYNYNIFTFDNLTFSISGDFGNNYLKFYPFTTFSFYSFTGRDSFDNPLPQYKFLNSQESITSFYITFGYILTSLRSSLGAITAEEGILYNLNCKLSSKNIGSIEDALILNNFFTYSLRLFGNSILRFNTGLRINISPYLKDSFYYGGFTFTEIFPREEEYFYELNLSSYSSYPDKGNVFLSSLFKLYLKFFEVNEGIWPIYITSVWSELGPKLGILFNGFYDILNRRVVYELVSGLFLHLNLIGEINNKLGIEVIYNPEGKFFTWNFILNLNLTLDIPFKAKN